MTGRGRVWRLALGFALSFAVLAPPAPPLAQDGGDRILVVSRARILSETAPALALREAEVALRADLRDWLNARKQSLDAEERTLPELRGDLPRTEFDQRSSEFDQRVRDTRRESQRIEATIQSAFRDARKELITALYPILIEVLRTRGGQVILDQDQILMAVPDIDVTDQVIALYNARVAAPTLPSFEVLAGGPGGIPDPPGGVEPEE